jgi:hypothetical protein
MYVRWITRARKSQFGPSDRGTGKKSDMAYQAVLVESVRVDGKWRQQFIAYLGGFTVSAIQIPAQRRYIWDRFNSALDRLGDRISAKDRDAIVAVVADKIGPPPTKEQREELDRQREEFLGAFSRAFQGGRKRKRPSFAPFEVVVSGGAKHQ